MAQFTWHANVNINIIIPNNLYSNACVESQVKAHVQCSIIYENMMVFSCASQVKMQNLCIWHFFNLVRFDSFYVRVCTITAL